MTSFYTRRGDDGFTGLLGEGRVPKYHPIPEAVGAVDEASAALGLARAACRRADTADWLVSVQRDLYHLMAEVAAAPENAARFRRIDALRVEWIERVTDQLSEQIEMPKEFILPGDSPAGAALGFARTVVRRAERRLAPLQHDGTLDNIHLLRYMNRLSSLCFVLEIYENAAAGQSDFRLAKDG